MQAAPFHRLDGDAESPARAFWLRADDGVRLRAALWRAPDGPPARGTVLLFPGRTEYLEKYDRVARDLLAAGFAVLGIDWRGQGASDRLLDDPRPGHVAAFADYQRDVVELIVAAQKLSLPQPWHLLAHSMGGAIGLAALHDGLPVVSAAFSAPMWGIRNPLPPVLAQGVAAAASAIGLRRRTVPGSGGRGQQTYVLSAGFADNLLTPCPANWSRLVTEAAFWPDLTLGGATFGWVATALAESARLSHLPAPDLPALASLGSDEQIVSPPAIRQRIADWPGARLVSIDGARHEVLFDTPARRDLFLNAALDLFGRHGG
ncbi:alpha/beta fold hydrolase [Paracoccus jiaweipingae]|uniref:alpha/beta fold hydrolase n=1 Tax=unclassified Paracoccus (in: a-proteobacteria) TaxID=2688777 RepID=UPI0037AFD9A6